MADRSGMGDARYALRHVRLSGGPPDSSDGAGVTLVTETGQRPQPLVLRNASQSVV